jgi:hypothetical protein
MNIGFDGRELEANFADCSGFAETSNGRRFAAAEAAAV